MLHCLLNQQFPHSQAPLSSTSWHNMPGPVLMTSSLLSLSLWTKPLGKEVSWTAAHACPLVPLRHTELSPVRRPCSVALQQQIILDDFILITFSLIFFYLHGDMPQWLRNIPQVGAHMPLWADAGTQEHTHWHFERKLVTIMLHYFKKEETLNRTNKYRVDLPFYWHQVTSLTVYTCFCLLGFCYTVCVYSFRP